MLRTLWGLGGFLAGWLLGSQRKAMRDVIEPDAHATAPAVDLAPLTEELDNLSEVAVALRESAAALEKQLGRVGREQFKMNTLGEAQQRQAQAALEQLRDLSARREADFALLQEQLRTDQSAQRLTLIQQLLPALDGLDEALAAGRRLLARQASPAKNPFTEKTGFSQRIAFALRVGRGMPPTTPTADAERGAWREPVAAWLEGLDVVRGRLLQVLAAEGVEPMTAQGERFDPHRHIAVEAVAASEETPPGTVVEEYRRGYQMGDQVLRAAEVVVAK